MNKLQKEFKKFEESLNLRENTIKEYIDSINMFEKWYLEKYNKKLITVKTYNNLTVDVTQQFIFDIRKKLSVSSVNKHIAGIKQFYKFLRFEYKVTSNAFNGLKIPKDTLKEEKKMMIQEEGELLFNSSKDKDTKLMIGLMLYMGMRINEVSNIELDNINLDEMTITFIRKNQRLRTLPIRSEIRELIIDKVKEGKLNNNTFLFEGRNNSAIKTNTIRTRFNNLVKKLGLSKEYTPHQLRKLLATDLYYNKGMLLHEVSKILDHSTLQVTERYLIGTSDSRLHTKFANL